jgi:hypothetical protein
MNYIGIPAGPWSNLADSLENVYWTQGKPASPAFPPMQIITAAIVVAAVLAAGAFVVLRKRREILTKHQ